MPSSVPMRIMDPGIPPERRPGPATRLAPGSTTFPCPAPLRDAPRRKPSYDNVLLPQPQGAGAAAPSRPTLGRRAHRPNNGESGRCPLSERDADAAREVEMASVDVEVVELPIAGMTCDHWVGTVRRALEGVPGVRSAAVDLASGRAEVAFAPARVDPARLKQAVESAGYSVPGPGASTPA